MCILLNGIRSFIQTIIPFLEVFHSNNKLFINLLKSLQIVLQLFNDETQLSIFFYLFL